MLWVSICIETRGSSSVVTLLYFCRSAAVHLQFNSPCVEQRHRRLLPRSCKDVLVSEKFDSRKGEPPCAMSSDADGGVAGFRHLSIVNISVSGSGFRCLGRGFHGNNNEAPWFLRHSASQTVTLPRSYSEKDTLLPPSKTLWGRSSSSAIRTCVEINQ